MRDSITSIPTLKEAIRVAVRKSGLKEKQVAWELDIEPPQWSRIMVGQGNFPEDKLLKFMEIVGNHIPLQWIAHQCGFELRVMTKTLEEELIKERAEKEELKKELEMINKVIDRLGSNFKKDD